MTYEYRLYRPGVTFIRQKNGTDMPVGNPPVYVQFEANSHTHAKNLAEQMFRESQKQMAPIDAKQAWWGVGLVKGE